MSGRPAYGSFRGGGRLRNDREDRVEPVGEQRCRAALCADQQAGDLVGRADQQVPDDRLIGDPGGREGQRDAERHHPRRKARHRQGRAAGQQADRIEGNVERERGGQRLAEHGVRTEQAAEGERRRLAAHAVDDAQRLGDARRAAVAECRASAHSAASRYMPSPSESSPGHGARVSSGYQCAGSSPTLARIASSRRTVASRPGQDRQQLRHSGQVQPHDDAVVGVANEEAAAVRRQRADQVQLVRRKAEARAIILRLRLRRSA